MLTSKGCDCHAAVDGQTGKNKGYAFVEFSDRVTANKVLDLRGNACVMDKRALVFQLAASRINPLTVRPKRDGPPGARTIFVKVRAVVLLHWVLLDGCAVVKPRLANKRSMLESGHSVPRKSA